jgi:hypothetical protein
MGARPRPTQSELVEDTLLVKPSVETPAVRLVGRRSDLLPSSRVALANLDLLGGLGRLDPLAFARYLITFSIGLAVALAWQSYGGAGKERIAPVIPSPDQQQFNAMLLNLEAVRQSVDRIANNMATNQEQMTRSVSQVAAGQEWMTREIADLQTVEQYLLDKISTPPPRPTHVTPRVPRSTQAPIQLTPASDR